MPSRTSPLDFDNIISKVAEAGEEGVKRGRAFGLDPSKLKGVKNVADIARAGKVATGPLGVMASLPAEFALRGGDVASSVIREDAGPLDVARSRLNRLSQGTMQTGRDMSSFIRGIPQQVEGLERKVLDLLGAQSPIGGTRTPKDVRPADAQGADIVDFPEEQAPVAVENADGTTSTAGLKRDLPGVEKAAGGGGFGIADPVSQKDKQLALSLYLRDRDFSGARNVAQTPGDLRLIELREQQFLNTDPRRARELRAAEQAFYGQQAAANLQQIKSAADIAKAGPLAAKQAAEANRTNLQLGLAMEALKRNPRDFKNILSMLSGIAPPKPTVSVSQPVLPGEQPQVTVVQPSGTQAFSVTPQKVASPGQTVQVGNRRFELLSNGKYRGEDGKEISRSEFTRLAEEARKGK